MLVAVTHHAVERIRQRAASRTGELDARPEIASRAARAWAAGRVSDCPPDGKGAGPRGALCVADLDDRDLVYVCRHDSRRAELVVITVWERERLGPSSVPPVPPGVRRFTDALRERGAPGAQAAGLGAAERESPPPR